MLFKTSAIAALAATGAIAAPVQSNGHTGINVLLFSKTRGVHGWFARGFSSTEAVTLNEPHDQRAFTHVKLLFSQKIKTEQPDLVENFRCALKDENGDRIIVTRGEKIDYTFGDNNVAASWELKNGPFKNVTVECDPAFSEFNQAEVDTVNVSLSGSEFARQAAFKNTDGKQVLSQPIRGTFRTATLTLGPAVANQKLRCQLTGPDGVVLLNRGTNVNKETFGDAGKGEWALDVAGDGVATVDTVTCDPAFN
ncbi:hypothetical protein HJFPF1_09686 [Paramyrothecium foliicola]|nr:hypothetical protein HJFPF1_09686 [Paramyrothecium foliicola]